jgi:hypothetical protein
MFLTAAGLGGGAGAAVTAGAGAAAAGVTGAALAGGGGSVAQPARQAMVSNNVGSEFCNVIMHLLMWMNLSNA